MEQLAELVSTLRFAVDAYAELSGGEGDSAAMSLRGSINVYARSIDDLESLDRHLETASVADAPIVAGLGNWRAGVDLAAFLRVVEREIARIAIAIQTSPVAEDVKRAIEPALVRNEENLVALDGEPEAEVEAFTLWGGSAVLDDDDVKAAEDPQGYRVWYATNRIVVEGEEGVFGYGNGLSDATSHGYCVVHVPKSHVMGSLGSNVLVRIVRGDDRLKVVGISPLSVDEFVGGLAGQIAEAPSGERHAVVFIHGYNVSFQDAALRAAQIGKDLGINGAMAFFSWPSKGRFWSYFADADSLAASTTQITDFLVAIATLPDVEHVHVIAHSIGNRGALQAVGRIAVEAERLSGRRFSQFVLAAADVAADVFRKESGPYLQLGEQTTLYVSSRDRALATSKRISEHDRVGLHPPLSCFEGFCTVDVGDVDLDRLGHGYVGDNKGVLGDLHQLIFSGKGPDARFGLERRECESGAYWAFKR
jgi:esterase/lipase superfamily enzyme